MVQLDKKKASQSPKGKKGGASKAQGLAKSPKSVPMKAKNKSTTPQKQAMGKSPKAKFNKQKKGKKHQTSKTEKKEMTPKEEKKQTPKEEKKQTPKEEKKQTPKEEKKQTSKEEKKQTPKAAKKQQAPAKSEQKNGQKRKLEGDDAGTQQKAKRVASNPDCEGFYAQVKLDTSKKDIETYFSQFGEVESIILLSKGRLSRGCGFISFKKASSLEKALKVKTHKIDDREIVFKRAKGTEKESVKNTVMVRDLKKPIQICDLEEHFAKFGKITRAYIPNIIQKQKRFYGFVTFEKPESMKAALKASHKVKDIDITCVEALGKSDKKKEEPKAVESNGKAAKAKKTEKVAVEEEDEDMEDDDDEEEEEDDDEEEEEEEDDDDEEEEDDDDEEEEEDDE